MACVDHLVYPSLGIALDDMDVPLRVLFSGTTTMTLLNSALDAERTLHTQPPRIFTDFCSLSVRTQSYCYMTNCNTELMLKSHKCNIVLVSCSRLRTI